MLITWYKKHKIRMKGQELLNSTTSILKSHNNEITPDIKSIIRERLNNLEESLNNNDPEKIQSSYSSLNNIFDQNLSQYSKSKIRQNIEAIVIALCLALLIRTFFFTAL